MSSKRVYRGQLNHQVELFQNTVVATTTGARNKTLVSIGKKFVKRIDAQGDEELDGRLIPLNVCKYIMRYDANIHTNGSAYVVRDLDGDWDIHSVILYGSNRKELIELKCSKRG